jgi:hypothetical protein
MVSSRGLEWLLPENRDVLRFLAGRAYGQRPPRAVCCWAAMQSPAAWEIQGELDDGNPDAALQLLQASAPFLGPVLPSDAGRAAWLD